jgi:hypothetical protein
LDVFPSKIAEGMSDSPANTRSQKVTSFLSLSNKSGIANYFKKLRQNAETLEGNSAEGQTEDSTLQTLIRVEIDRRVANERKFFTASPKQGETESDGSDSRGNNSNNPALIPSTSSPISENFNKEINT